MTSEYDDDRAIADVYWAISGGKSLEEILDLARKIRNPNREEFSNDRFYPPVHKAVITGNAALIRKLITELNFRPDAIWTYCQNKTPAHLAVSDQI